MVIFNSSSLENLKNFTKDRITRDLRYLDPTLRIPLANGKGHRIMNHKELWINETFIIYYIDSRNNIVITDGS